MWPTRYGSSSFTLRGTFKVVSTVLLYLNSLTLSLRCGVCQHFAATLETVAQASVGRMAVATVDCTTEVALCKQRFQITAYPTLMYAHYGTIEDFPLQHDRPVDDYVDFARRMSMPAVTTIKSIEEAHRFAEEQGTDGVAFLACDPIDDESSLLKTFKEASRRLQRHTSFAALQSSQDVAANVLSQGPFICRLEKDIPMRCFHQTSELMELDSLLDWVERERIPTVSRLTASSLEELSQRGRLLCLVVYEQEREASRAEDALKRFATNGSPSLRDHYFYGSMEYPKYKRYLEHLGFESLTTFPQLFVKNMATKEYWQNATYGLDDLERFIRDVESGIVLSQSVRKKGKKSLLKMLKNLFNKNRPWSYLVLIGQGVAFFVLLYQYVKVRESLRPPYPRNRSQQIAKSLASECKPFVPGRNDTATKKKDN